MARRKRQDGLKNFQVLDGRYITRIAIPAPLRPYLDGKRELRHPHGDSLTRAERAHPGVQARFLDMLDDAKARHAADHAPARSSVRERAVSLDEFSRGHYSATLNFDAAMREQAPSFARLGIDDDYVASLREIKSGTAQNEQIEATVGHLIDAFRKRGRVALAFGSAEYRATGCVLAGVEYEALSRMAERDDGDPESEPQHPALVAPQLRASDASPKGAAVSILGLLGGYLKELAASGRGAEAERRWTPGFKGFVRFLGHDDARLVSRDDVIGWKDALLETLAAKTVRDTNVAALRAVFQWAIDNRRIPRSSTHKRVAAFEDR